jgi:hypothetical protein
VVRTFSGCRKGRRFAPLTSLLPLVDVEIVLCIGNLLQAVIKEELEKMNIAKIIFKKL